MNELITPSSGRTGCCSQTYTMPCLLSNGFLDTPKPSGDTIESPRLLRTNQMDQTTKQHLCNLSLAARENAYAPYSEFQVGSVILTNNGRIYAGANVENASLGLTICAERVAAGSAVADGHRQLAAIAIASPGGHTPCGACRQFLAEFSNRLLVLLIDSNDPTQVSLKNLKDLLPDDFQSAKLK